MRQHTVSVWSICIVDRPANQNVRLYAMLRYVQKSVLHIRVQCNIACFPVERSHDKTLTQEYKHTGANLR